jgi:putative transposase
MYRKYPIETDCVYHIFSKSIAGYKIFSRKKDFLRIGEVVKYYQFEKVPLSFSHYIQVKKRKDNNFDNEILQKNKHKLVEIIAYCFMPTHIHLALKQLKNNGISIFMNRILSSYTRYFNLLYARKGPLWEGRFKNILVESDDQLYHLTRYIHLNPVSADLVNDPKDWSFSSYKEYIKDSKNKICKYNDFFKIEPDSYQQFVKDNISYQRQLQIIKNLMLD